MKRNLRSRLSTLLLAALLIVCGAVVLAPAVLRAQGFPGQEATPEQTAAAKVQRYTQLLGLSSAQGESALAIFTTEATAEAPIRKAEKSGKEVLESAVKASNTSTMAQVSAMLGELNGQSTLVKATADAQFWALLTSDQQARYTQLQAQQQGQGAAGSQGGGMMNGMPGGMGFGGPPPRR